MQISYCVCPKIQKNGDIQTIKSRCRKNIENIMRTKESEYNRSGMLSRPYSYVSGDTAAYERIKFHGIFEK